MRHGLVLHVRSQCEHTMFVSDLHFYACRNDSEVLCCRECLLIGFPHEMRQEELEGFIEPFLHQLEDYQLIVRNHSSSSPQKLSNLVILKFFEPENCRIFTDLYNNLHFPTHRDLPPCLVVPLGRFNAIDAAIFNHSAIEECRQCLVSDMSVSVRDHQLPVCCVCLRRIRVANTGIGGGNDIPSLKTVLCRCKVCCAFSNHNLQAQGATSIVAVDRTCCKACGLSDNIWVCMICCYAGCGRYSRQHAQHHFNESGHPLSLELATGRIWDYTGDIFVHIDRDSGYSEAGTYFQPLPSSTLFPVEGSSSQQLPPDKKSTMTWQPTSSVLQGPDLREPTSTSNYVLHEKLGSVSAEYEDLLQSQLTQQQLYFEKQLAQETMRALEKNLEAYHVLNRTEAVACPTNSKRILELAEADLTAITDEKLDLSAAEYTYSELLVKINLTEAAIRKQQKANEILIRKQRSLKETVERFNSQAALARRQCAEKVEDLEQQIRDLSFFLRTKSQLSGQATSDIRGGNVFVPSPAPIETRKKKSTKKM